MVEARPKREAPEGHVYETAYNKYKDDRANYGFIPIDFDTWADWHELWVSESQHRDGRLT